MSLEDRRPLANAPKTNQIRRIVDNRLGAVYSALYSFWIARNAATAMNQGAVGQRHDAYSVLLFNNSVKRVLANDVKSSPDRLLDAVLRYQAHGKTNFEAALRAGGTVMELNWSTERKPVMIFLSDGECEVPDTAIQELCRTAVRLGAPLSFHSISFGPESSSSYLRRMADLALEIQNDALPNARNRSTASVPSSYSVALDTVRLAETFLGIAESLRKTRGALIR